MAASCIKFVLNNPFVFGLLPIRVKNGIIVNSSSSYLLRKFLIIVMFIASALYYNSRAGSLKSTIPLSKFTFSVAIVVRTSYLVYEDLEYVILLVRKRKLIAYVQEIIGISNKAYQPKFSSQCMKFFTSIFLFHAVLIPFSLFIFPLELDIQLSTVLFTIFSMYETVVSAFLILLLELIRTSFDQFKIVTLLSSHTVLMKFLNIQDIFQAFLNLFGEILISKIVVSFLILTLDSYLLIYASFFMAPDIKHIGLLSCLFYDIASIPSLIALVTCQRFCSTTEMVSLLCYIIVKYFH